MPAAEVALFQQNIGYARDLAGTAVALASHVTAAINTDDLLRASLVHGVSALDHFVHEEVRSRMLLIQLGQIPKAKAFAKFRVSVDSVNQASTSSNTSWLEAEVREQHSHLSFQSPDKIADALRLVTDISLWSAVADQLSVKADDLKRHLKLIVDRRNKIAHEADTDPTPPRTRYAIDATMVQESLDFIEQITMAIATAI